MGALKNPLRFSSVCRGAVRGHKADDQHADKHDAENAKYGFGYEFHRAPHTLGFSSAKTSVPGKSSTVWKIPLIGEAARHAGLAVPDRGQGLVDVKTGGLEPLDLGGQFLALAEKRINAVGAMGLKMVPKRRKFSKQIWCSCRISPERSS